MSGAESGDGQLERRVRRLEDRQELRDLVARYCVASDDSDLETLAELFADDAVYVGPSGRVEGSEAVIEYLRETLGRSHRSIHSVHDQIVDWDGEDAATGIVTAHIEMALTDADATLFGALRYRDRYVREGGRWRLAERALEFIHMGPWSRVEGSLTAEAESG